MMFDHSNQLPSFETIPSFLPPLDVPTDSEPVQQRLDDKWAVTFGQPVYPPVGSPPSTAIVPTVQHITHNNTSSEDVHNTSMFSTYTTASAQPKCGPVIPRHGYPVPSLKTYPLAVPQPHVYFELVPLREYKAAPGFELIGGKPQAMRFLAKDGNPLMLGLGPEFDLRCGNLVDGGMKMKDGGQKASLRIPWPKPKMGGAYVDWRPQVTVRRSTLAGDPIPWAKLARIIRKQLGLFIEHNKNTSYGDPDWKVGPGGIELKDLYLIAVRVVSKGSIQPVIAVKRSWGAFR